MGERNIRKETKKPKKSAEKPSAGATAPQSFSQPTVIKKEKKIR